MWIKICGMSDQAAIDKAAELGVDLCGFVSFSKSPRNIDAEHAARLDTHGMARVGVFVSADIPEIRRFAETARLDFLQLHGGQSDEIARHFPAERVIRVLWPKNYETPDALQADINRFARTCGRYLLDAGMGSGKTLDWTVLDSLRFPHPWFLSGGLGPQNIGQALRICHPDGVDLNSKLEDAPGHKSVSLIEDAVRVVRNASPQTGNQPRARRNIP